MRVTINGETRNVTATRIDALLADAAPVGIAA